jgi:hypothetical protein
MGAARAIGAVVFSIVVGLSMHFLFRKDEEKRAAETEAAFGDMEDDDVRPLWQTAAYVATMVFILIFAAWAKPAEQSGFWWEVYKIHWFIVLPLLALLGLMLWRWFSREEISEWTGATWGFAAQIMPLLFLGVLAAGLLLGMPGSDNGLIPNEWVAKLVGGNSLRANFFASVVAAFMYVATLTEVPILQGLMGSGMGKGPALALLLAGPALSLPNMLVIRSILGTKKTIAFVSIIVILATLTGMIYGAIAA